MRLDQRLTMLHPELSRSRLQDMIKEGRILVNGKCIVKSSFAVSDEDEIEIVTPEIAFASRAGWKLYDVLDDFQIDLTGRVCLDVGASTGGFSDVCLQRGAKKVYAVDVGRDQLLPRLRKDPRVVNMEGVNCRYLRKEQFTDRIDFICMDVSFISAKLILPALFPLMNKIDMVILIKPQFEAGKSAIGKHGIIKDAKVHQRVLRDMVSFVNEYGFQVTQLQVSSLPGRDGNREFVMHIQSKHTQPMFDYAAIVARHKERKG